MIISSSTLNIALITFYYHDIGIGNRNEKKKERELYDLLPLMIWFRTNRRLHFDYIFVTLLLFYFLSEKLL